MSTLYGYTNTDIWWKVRLKDETGAAKDFTDPSDWTIQAVLFDLGTGTKSFTEAAQSKTASGASWADGWVVIEFAETDTASLDAGKYGLEIKATNGINTKRWQHRDIRLKEAAI